MRIDCNIVIIIIIIINTVSVYVPYCSSDLYSGTASASAETENRVFYGKHIVKAVVDDLIANTWIAQAEQVGE